MNVAYDIIANEPFTRKTETRGEGRLRSLKLQATDRPVVFDKLRVRMSEAGSIPVLPNPL